MITNDDVAERSRAWLANYHGSIDVTALLLAHQAGQRAAVAAAGARKAMDRASLGAHILAALPDEVWQEGADVIAMHAADAALTFLAARGDSATATVTAEQVQAVVFEHQPFDKTAGGYGCMACDGVAFPTWQGMAAHLARRVMRVPATENR